MKRFEACPLCQSANIVVDKIVGCTLHSIYRTWMKPYLTWMECTDCKHSFIMEYREPAEEARLLTEVHDYQRPGFEYEKYRPVAATMIDSVLACMPQSWMPILGKTKWLDVGFGNAALLLTAKEYGFHAVGTDARLESVEAASSLGLDVYTAKEFKTAILSERFSIISICDVLEHMANPKGFLLNMKDRLYSWGLLLLSMPAYNSPAWNLLDPNPYWAEVEHYHNFSYERLSKLLAELGFTVIKYGVSRRYRAGMEVVARL